MKDSVNLSNEIKALTIKYHKYLTPTLVVGGVMLYCLVGWMVTVNYFNITQDILTIFFEAACLVVNLYIFSKIFEEKDKWTNNFIFVAIVLAPIFCSMALGGIVQEYAFVVFSIFVLIYAISAIEKISIEGVLKFFSIIASYLGFVSMVYSFGKRCLEKWLSIISSIVDIRFVIMAVVFLMIIVEAFIAVLKEKGPKIRLIPELLFTPKLSKSPFDGIVEGFKKTGVWIWNNGVYFLNIIWIGIAFLMYYIFETLKRSYKRIESFIKHSDTVISVTATIFGLILFVDFTICLSKYELQYLLTSDIFSLLNVVFQFLIIVLLSVIIKTVFYFRYSRVNYKYISEFYANTFSGMVQAPFTVAAYYCGTGWALVAVSYALLKIFNFDFLPHFHYVGVYTILATITIGIIILIVSRDSPKNDNPAVFDSINQVEEPISFILLDKPGLKGNKLPIILFLLIAILFVFIMFIVFAYPKSDQENNFEVKKEPSNVLESLPIKQRAVPPPVNYKPDTLISKKAEIEKRKIPNPQRKEAVDISTLRSFLINALASSGAGDFSDAIGFLRKAQKVNNIPLNIKQEIKESRVALMKKDKVTAMSKIKQILKTINNLK